MKKEMFTFAASVVLGSAMFQPALAAYPERAVRIVVPYSAGGPTDVSARLVAQKLSQSLGKPVVVENITGAGGNIGTGQVARSPADGYTLLVAGGAYVINMALYAKPGYDVKKDFVNVALLVTAPMILLAHSGLPVSNVAELVALAKAKPGALSYGSSTIGAVGHLAMELFKTQTGTNFLHIPYKGAAPAMNDLAGGHISVLLNSMVVAMNFAKTGKAKALAVTSAQRTSLAPDLPTVSESGVPGFEATVWYGLFAPAATPPAVVQLVHAETNKALKLPDVRKPLIDSGSEPGDLSLDQFNRFIDAELVKWSAIVKASGLKSQ